MENCLFCDVVEGSLPTEKIYEDKNFVAIKDINPKAEYHYLIIPKKHTDNITEFSLIYPDQVPSFAQIAQQLVDENSNGEYQLIFNTGPTVGQSVFHVHGHVLSGALSSPLD